MMFVGLIFWVAGSAATDQLELLNKVRTHQQRLTGKAVVLSASVQVWNKRVGKRADTTRQVAEVRFSTDGELLLEKSENSRSLQFDRSWDGNRQVHLSYTKDGPHTAAISSEPPDGELLSPETYLPVAIFTGVYRADKFFSQDDGSWLEVMVQVADEIAKVEGGYELVITPTHPDGVGWLFRYDLTLNELGMPIKFVYSRTDPGGKRIVHEYNIEYALRDGSYEPVASSRLVTKNGPSGSSEILVFNKVTYHSFDVVAALSSDFLIPIPAGIMIDDRAERRNK